jgi:uncharacterized protein YbaP (TraB family)
VQKPKNEMKKLIFFVIILINVNGFAQNTILWRITDTINDKQSFLLGSYHDMGNSFIDSIPEIRENLYNSDLAIFESVDTIMPSVIINSRDYDNNIGDKIPKRYFKQLEIITENWETDYTKLEPHELRVVLIREFGKTKCGNVKPTDKWNHFDLYLIHLAKQKEIKCFGLETYSQQLELLEKEPKPPWEKEKENICYWIAQVSGKKIDKKNCNFSKWYKNFKLPYQFETECKDNMLIEERNNAWMEQLPELLHENNAFVVVGFMHLIRKCGLIEQLRRQGFLVEPVELEKASW